MKFKWPHFFSLSFVLGLLVALYPSASFAAATLHDLDRVVSKAKNLDEFLSNEALINEYYKSLASYYGEDRFPRVSFDAILTQLREVSGKVPEIKEKLWSKQGLGQGLSIRALPATDNLNYDPKRFAEFNANYRKELEKQAASLLNASNSKAEAQSVLARLEQKIASFQADLEKSDLSKKQKGERSAEFFKSLEHDKDSKALSSYLALERMNLPEVKKNLSSGSPEIILSELERLRQSPPSIPGLDLTNRLVSATRQGVPTIDTVINKSGAFRSSDGSPLNIRLESQTYDFKPIERRLHGIWKGVFHKECVGGSCETLGELVPDRWAVSALDGTRVYHVEKDGRFQGYVQEVPMKRDGKLYTSIDVVAPEMEKIVVEADKASGETKVRSLFDAWYVRASKNLPKGSSGYIVGNSDSIRNGRGPSIVRASPYYVQGQVLADSKEFETVDKELEKQIVSLYERDVKKELSRGAMIHETGVKGAEGAVLLGPDTIDEKLLEDAEWIRNAFSATDPDAFNRETRIFAAFEHRKPNPAVLKELQKEANTIMDLLDKRSGSAWKFIQLGSNSTIRSLLKYSIGTPKSPEDLKKIADAGQKIIEVSRSNGAGIGAFLIDNAKAIADTHPSFEQAVDFRSRMVYLTGVDGFKAVDRVLVETIQTPQQFIEYFGNPSIFSGERVIAHNNQFLKEHLREKFLEKGASPSNALELIRRVSTSNHATIASAVAEQARTPAEFTALFTRVRVDTTAEYNRAVDEALAKSFDHFLNLKPPPSIDEVVRVQRLIVTPDVYVQTMKKSLARFEDPEDVVKLMNFSSPHPADEERKKVANMIVELKDDLARKKLTTKQWQNIRTALSGYAEADVALMELEFARLQDPVDYLKTIEFKQRAPSPAFREAHSDFVSKTLPKFLEMHPPAHVVNELVRRNPSLEANVRPYLNATAPKNTINSCTTSVRQLLLRFGNR